MHRLPIHPRLSRMLVAADGARSIARACAVLSERQFMAPRSAATHSDLLSAVDDWTSVPPHVERVAREIERIAADLRAGSGEGGISRGGPLSETDFLRAVLAGYPDRVARRREPGSPRVRLASGGGATVGPQSGVRDGEFLVAVDVTLTARGPTPAPDTLAPSRSGVSRTGRRWSQNDADAVVRIASRVDREWLTPTGVEIVHRFDADAGVVRAAEVEQYDALPIRERPIAPHPSVASDLLAAAWMARGPLDADARLVNRLKFAGLSVDIAAAIRTASLGVRSLQDVHLERGLPPDTLGAVGRDAPDTLRVPSGRAVTLEYRDDGEVSASVKLQELFGLADTPRIGPRRAPVLLALLAPNGRPVQMTRDLKSFWERTYPEVRRELRGRYPKHPWPEDPWNAAPTARTTRRSRP
jgi:ATP-dependent helicase HrpB